MPRSICQPGHGADHFGSDGELIEPMGDADRAPGHGGQGGRDGTGRKALVGGDPRFPAASQAEACT